MPAQLSFFATPPTPGRLLFSLTIPRRLPSWNELLGMEQWARYKFKKDLAGVFLCALRASAADCSTKTTCARSTMLIYADTLESCLQMRQEQRRLRSAKKRLDQKSPSGSKSKSSSFKKPAGKVAF